MSNENRLKILLVAPSPELAGGIARWTQHILGFYNKTKPVDCELDFLCQAAYKEILERKGFKRIISGISNYRGVAQELKQTLKTKKYSAIHITTSASISLLKDIWLLKIARQNDAKCVIHFHFGRIPELVKLNNWEWKLIKKVLKLAHKVVVIDMLSCNTLRDLGYTNVELLPNPVSDKILELVEENQGQVRQPRSISFVGQMIPTKGIYELVEVCRELDNITLNMYGLLPSGVKEKLTEVAGKDSNKWLNITGEVPYDTVVKRMMESELFVLPTYTEGFPNVIIESMACGCPIISTSVGAIPEMLDIDSTEPCGMCISPQNKEQLKKAINYMFDNPEQAKKMGQRAIKRVKEQYSMASVWNGLIQIWGD